MPIKPHKVVIWVKAELHEIMPNGACAPLPLATTGNVILFKDTENEEEGKKFVEGLNEMLKSVTDGVVEICLKQK